MIKYYSKYEIVTKKKKTHKSKAPVWNGLSNCSFNELGLPATSKEDIRNLSMKIKNDVAIEDLFVSKASNRY